VLLLGRHEIEALVDLDELIDAMAGAMADLSAGRSSTPNRVGARVEERDGTLLAMPGYTPSAGMLASKLLTLFPRNAGGALPTHQALLVAFDHDDGHPVALLEATALTELRTGAASALATKLLAREDAKVLALLGTGAQARSHPRALSRVRRFDEVRVAGRNPDAAEALVTELARELEPRVVRSASFAEACDGADVVCAVTHATEPVVRREWLSPGAHVVSIGYNPEGREVDDQTVVDALVFVESRAAALAPPPAGTNDLVEPLEAGLITPGHVRAEIGEIVEGSARGRMSPEQLTLYKSVGVAVQDGAAAAVALRAARERGVGRRIDL
jgi:alanine dehydrogenase